MTRIPYRRVDMEGAALRAYLIAIGKLTPGTITRGCLPIHIPPSVRVLLMDPRGHAIAARRIAGDETNEES